MKKILFITTCFVFLLSYGQQSKIDSLAVDLQKSKTDTIKMQILSRLEGLTLRTDFEKSQQYNTQLLELSKDRSKKYYANALEHKGMLETQQAHYEEAERNYLKALKIYKELKRFNDVSDIYKNTARLSYMSGDADRAKEYYLKAISVDSINHSEKRLAHPLLGVGIINLSQNNFKEAIRYFLKSLSISEKYNLKVYIAHNTKRIADAYLMQENDGKAKEYLLKAKATFEEMDNIEGLAGVYNSLGIIEEKKENYKESLNLSLKSLDCFKKVNNKNQIILLSLNTGLQYDKIEDKINAYTYYTNALKLSRAIKSKKYIAKSLLSLAKIEIDINKFKMAKKHINEMELLDVDLEKEFRKVDNYEFIANSYAEKGMFSDAYRFLLKHYEIKTRLFEKIKKEEFAELETKYQTSKKEKQLIKKAYELKIVKQDKKLYLISTFSIGIISLFLTLSLYYFYKKYINQRNKLKKTISEVIKLKEKIFISNNQIEIAKVVSFREYLKEIYKIDKLHIIEVWESIGEGVSRKDYSIKTKISENTIKKYRDELYKKIKEKNGLPISTRFNVNKAAIEYHKCLKEFDCKN